MTFALTYSWSLAAAPERVFRALTDPAELMQWFAEGATVESYVGGVYRFWGRHTLRTPPQDAARQTISRYDPPTTLGFNWPIDEVDTDVLMNLVPDENGTKLTITHRVFGDLNVPRQQELIDDHWRVAIGNLITHLAGSRKVVMPDYFALHKKSTSEPT